MKRSLNTLLIIAHIFFDFHRQLFRSLFQQIGTFTLHFILQLACKLLNVLFFIFDTLGFDSSCNLINGQHRCAILCAFIQRFPVERMNQIFDFTLFVIVLSSSFQIRILNIFQKLNVFLPIFDKCLVLLDFSFQIRLFSGNIRPNRFFAFRINDFRNCLQNSF